MLKKIIITILLTILISEAADFIKYDRALRITPAYYQENGDLKGGSISFNYVQCARKALFEFSLIPKYLYWGKQDVSGNNIIVFSDTSFYRPKYSSSSEQKLTLGASILFSHRPSLKVRDGAGALTFNFWRYGVCFDWEIYKKYKWQVDEWERESVENSKDLDKYIGLTYNPLIGVQITDRINLSVELIYTWGFELFDNLYLYPKFGSGISFTISNPVKSF